ncbi:uncharacterized protein LOC112043712 [Bicyclus anynana]|uniref:Uncharacterized protein LOC112043712 n=1 Tax=Bicyclus anynana TaxID=110368 RepID=A0A6J1MKS2_BICAN|nr:uncharacterized protein LOC112043712 [Bicyclus anynana]XP_023935005.1 uncharacterized protein LOC112043712 [Bicyclus anynana]XP_023935007.1 uncharacterized protein LOC112043712 [Bicyclus anynana]
MASHFATILLWLGGSVFGLRDIQLSVPEAVGVGASASLGCRWALDTGEALYTVKWYHGAQEFFRFVPKELPNTRVFSQTGISVDVSRSGAQQVVLRGATRSLSGRYRCEVSADAPFFHTVYKSAYMRVVELPESGPKVLAQKSWYTVGDMLRANCTSPPSDPTANLTWLLNGYEVKGLDIPLQDTQFPPRQQIISDASLEDANRIIFSPWDALSGYEDAATDIIDIPGDVALSHKNNFESTTSLALRLEQIASKNISVEEEKSNKSSSFSQLVIRVQASHFYKGRLNITCLARILSVWSASGFLLLDEERPQIAPVMGSRDSNSGSRCSTSHVAALLNYLLLKLWAFR